MTINNVSFGRIVDVVYRYDKNDSNGKINAMEKCAKMSDQFSHSVADVYNLPYSVVSVASDDPKKRCYPQGNRLISKDDWGIYRGIKSVLGEAAATKFADKHAEKLIVDV